MKTRLITCLILVLALCLLLTSCAAGLPGATLFGVATDKLSAFSSKLENLMNDNVPLILEGKSDYCVQLPVTASTEVKNAVTSLCDVIEAKTGVRLTVHNGFTDQNRIVVGDVTDKTDAALQEKLNVANFYVGFVEEDIVIHAKNDIMLLSALHYFTEQFLTASNANVGAGYFYLPASLDFLAPVVVLDASSFKLGRVGAEGADWITNRSISNAYDRIVEKTGVRLSITPYTQKELETQKELLVGSVSRAETDDIIASLSSNQFYFGADGTKVMVLAANGRALWYGLNAFLDVFLDSEAAIYDAEAKTWTLPSYCHYYVTYETQPQE